MGQRVTLAVFFFLLVSTSAVADEPRPLPKELQGEWVAVEVEYRGKRPPAGIVSKYKVTVKEDKLILAPLNLQTDGKFNVEGELHEVRCKYDSNANPKAIDMSFKNFGEEAQMLGIYAIEGKQLKICWQHGGKERPKEFKTKQEPSQMLVILERAKK
jgi:uncharacterized protein (TIGR03067 family)